MIMKKRIYISGVMQQPMMSQRIVLIANSMMVSDSAMSMATT